MSKLIRCDLIDRSPWADLFDHPEDHISALAEDIKERGIQTPLQVYPRSGRYELLTGHDRLEAAKRVGIKDVVCEERSTLTDEDARFRHFVSDNAIRKPVSARRIADFVLRKHPDWSLSRIAQMANCSVGLVHEVKESLKDVVPELFTVKTVGKDGIAQPSSKPRQPKVTNGKPLSRVDAMRAMRESQAPAESAAFPETPKGFDVAGAMQAFHEERKADPFLILQDFINATPTTTKPSRLTDEQFATAASDPRFNGLLWQQVHEVWTVLGRILAHQPASEVRSA